MTDEGKILLEDIVAQRRYYEQRQQDFEAFARRNSEIYARQQLQKTLGIIAFVVGIPVFFMVGPGLTKWLAMFSVILGCIAAVSAKQDKIEMWRLAKMYVQQQGRAEEEKEVAYRVFMDEKQFADLPALQTGIHCGWFTIDDIDAYGLCADS